MSQKMKLGEHFFIETDRVLTPLKFKWLSTTFLYSVSGFLFVATVTGQVAKNFVSRMPVLTSIKKGVPHCCTPAVVIL